MENKIFLYNEEDKTVFNIGKFYKKISSLWFNFEGNKLISGEKNGKLRLFDLNAQCRQINMSQ